MADFLRVLKTRKSLKSHSFINLQQFLHKTNRKDDLCVFEVFNISDTFTKTFEVGVCYVMFGQGFSDEQCLQCE